MVIIHRLRPYTVWMVIALAGTFNFWHYHKIQNELIYQQRELKGHQYLLIQQLKVNEKLRLSRSSAISQAILKQCVEDYSIDQKLARLGMELLTAPSLDDKAKQALADFTSEVSKNQESLQCRDPMPTSLKKTPRLL